MFNGEVDTLIGISFPMIGEAMNISSIGPGSVCIFKFRKIKKHIYYGRYKDKLAT